jgi:hypothetical protein
MPSLVSADVPIFDIRQDKRGESLKDLVVSGLTPSNGQPKTLPALILYDGTRFLSGQGYTNVSRKGSEIV